MGAHRPQPLFEMWLGKKSHLFPSTLLHNGQEITIDQADEITSGRLIRDFVAATVLSNAVASTRMSCRIPDQIALPTVEDFEPTEPRIGSLNLSCFSCDVFVEAVDRREDDLEVGTGDGNVAFVGRVSHSRGDGQELD